MSLVDEVIEAHGGFDRWRQASSVRLRLSSGGLAFATKGQGGALHDLTATVSTRGQAVTLDAPTWSCRFDSQIPKPRGLRWSGENQPDAGCPELQAGQAIPNQIAGAPNE